MRDHERCYSPGFCGLEAENRDLIAENARLTALLHRWLLAASAMGGGPRAVLTQDTLAAVGMPDV